MPVSRRSKVWSHFTKLSQNTARCLRCSKILRSCGSTTNLKKHLSVHRSREWMGKPEIIADVVPKKESMLDSAIEGIDDWDAGPSTESVVDGQKTIAIKILQDNSVSYPAQSNQIIEEIHIEKQESFYDDDPRDSNVTNCILYFLCKDSAPFSLIAGQGFKYLMKQIAPFYRIPSQEALKKRFDLKFELASISYKSHFSVVEHFTISTDIWTDTASSRSFLDVTVHYLYRGLIKSIAIETAEITDRYTVDHIGTSLADILATWNIDYAKVVAVVTGDNVDTTAAVHQTFGFQKHLICFVNGLNSIATKTLYCERLDEVFEKVRTIVKWVKDFDDNDDLRKRQISDGTAEENIKELILDDKTQWTSSFSMLERFSELYELLNDMLIGQPEAPMMPSDVDIAVISQVLNLLRLLKQAMKEVTDQSKVTISKIIPIVNCLKLKLSKFTHELKIVRDVKNEMEQHVGRRFGFIEHNILMAAATLLDPRFKDIHFNDPVAADSAKASIRSMIRADLQGGYNPEDGKDKDGFDFWSHHNELAYKQIVGQDQTGVRDELSIYLSSSLTSIQNNPLESWQDIKSTFPRLFRQAMKYLTVVTSALPAAYFASNFDGMKNCQQRILGERMNKYFFLKSCPEEEWFA